MTPPLPRHPAAAKRETAGYGVLRRQDFQRALAGWTRKEGRLRVGGTPWLFRTRGDANRAINATIEHERRCGYRCDVDDFEIIRVERYAR